MFVIIYYRDTRVLTRRTGAIMVLEGKYGYQNTVMKNSIFKFADNATQKFFLGSLSEGA